MHLKRIAAPKSWTLARKEYTYIVRPHPGRHSLSQTLSITSALKTLVVADTTRDVRKALVINKVLVDGKRINSYRAPVGLYDRLTVNDTHHRIILDDHGRLIITPSTNEVKPARIQGKHSITGGKTQLTFSDGRTIITDKKVTVGSTALYNPQKPSEFKEVTLSEGTGVLLIKGKHAGLRGTFTGFKGTLVEVKTNNETLLTTKQNAFALPEDYTP